MVLIKAWLTTATKFEAVSRCCGKILRCTPLKWKDRFLLTKMDINQVSPQPEWKLNNQITAL